MKTETILLCRKAKRVIVDRIDGSFTFGLDAEGKVKMIHAAPIGMRDMARSFTNDHPDYVWEEMTVETATGYFDPEPFLKGLAKLSPKEWFEQQYYHSRNNDDTNFKTEN
jgi:hypothetical protein